MIKYFIGTEIILAIGKQIKEMINVINPATVSMLAIGKTNKFVNIETIDTVLKKYAIIGSKNICADNVTLAFSRIISDLINF